MTDRQDIDRAVEAALAERDRRAADTAPPAPGRRSTYEPKDAPPPVAPSRGEVGVLTVPGRRIKPERVVISRSVRRRSKVQRAAEARVAARRARREASRCPRCGAIGAQKCTTKTGKQAAAPHAARTGGAQ